MKSPAGGLRQRGCRLPRFDGRRRRRAGQEAEHDSDRATSTSRSTRGAHRAPAGSDALGSVAAGSPPQCHDCHDVG